MPLITNTSKEIRYRGKTVTVPVAYDDIGAITGAELYEATHELRRIAESTAHFDQMMRNYKDHRTGFIRHTGVLSPNWCLHHEDAIVETIRNLGCAHYFGAVDSWTTVNPVLATSTTMQRSTCQRCGFEKSEVVARNNFSGD